MAINEYVCYRICAYHFMYPKNHAEKKFMLNLAAPRNWRPYAAHILHSAKAGSALVFLYAPSLLFPALWKHSSTRAIFVDIIHHLY